MTTTPRDADWHEREYNPRLLVPHAPSLYEGWEPRAHATRERHPPITVRYGDHPREYLHVFRAPDARGTVLFIHGGYWRAFSTDTFSWVADAFLADEVTVALLNYPLCPGVILPAIVDSARRGFVHLYAEVLDARERERVVVTGHSAGGYLAALHLATDWDRYGLPPEPLAGAVPISGVFDVAPLIPTSMNEALRLDADTAAALDLTREPVRSAAPLALFVGGDESAEFHRQSDALAANWADLDPRVVDVPGRNHFDVIEGLAERDSELYRTITGMLGRR